jgi:hypothetical protein
MEEISASGGAQEIEHGIGAIVDSDSRITKFVAMMPKFNGEKFNLYKYKLKLVMEKDDTWKIVTGQVSRPENLAAAATYDKKAQSALTIIAFTLEDTLLHHIKDVDSPKEAWDILEGEYEPKGLSNTIYLRKRFFSYSMKSGDSMLAHITGLKALASELAVVGAPVSNKDIVLTLLCSLPESYQSLTIALESRAEELTLQFVTQRLLHEEMKRSEKAGSSSSSHALFTGQKKQSFSQKSSQFGVKKPQHDQQHPKPLYLFFRIVSGK